MRWIGVKRIYERPDKKDGIRILVDRLWPRGLRRDRVKIDLWLKEAAPGSELRVWFSHRVKRWNEFKERYFEELRCKKHVTGLIIDRAREEKVTLLYGAKDEVFNNAVALKEYIRNELTKK